jgi:hypothetical protein
MHAQLVSGRHDEDGRRGEATNSTNEGFEVEVEVELPQ